MKVLVAGASGFVGQRLCAALGRACHDVVAIARNPARYRGAGTPARGDVQDPARHPGPAMAPCQAAYYLVHSLQDADFEHKDAAGATAFGDRLPGWPDRVIYLGGLGYDADNLSAHLRSRREVESLLGAGGVPVTVIRAGIIIGHGGISWELTRQLVEHLPVMITPQWVATRTQPIAVDDVVTYLAGVLEPPEASGQVYEVGGPEVLRYSDDAAPGRRHREPPAAPPARAAAHPLAVLAVADRGHRHRHRYRPGPHRLHDQRGDRARPVDQGPDPDPAHVLRRRRARGAPRTARGPAGPLVTARRAAGLRAAAWLGAAGLAAAVLLRASFAAKAGSTRFYW